MESDDISQSNCCRILWSNCMTYMWDHINTDTSDNYCTNVRFYTIIRKQIMLKFLRPKNTQLADFAKKFVLKMTLSLMKVLYLLPSVNNGQKVAPIQWGTKNKTLILGCDKTMFNALGISLTGGQAQKVVWACSL